MKLILPKKIHERFGADLRRWKEVKCQKHDMSLRSTLKAGVDKKKRKQAEQPVTPQPDESAIDNNKKAKTS